MNNILFGCSMQCLGFSLFVWGSTPDFGPGSIALRHKVCHFGIQARAVYERRLSEDFIERLRLCLFQLHRGLCLRYGSGSDWDLEPLNGFSLAL